MLVLVLTSSPGFAFVLPAVIASVGRPFGTFTVNRIPPHDSKRIDCYALDCALDFGDLSIATLSLSPQVEPLLNGLVMDQNWLKMNSE